MVKGKSTLRRTRLNLAPKNGNGKGLFQQLKSKVKKETHLVPFRESGNQDKPLPLPTQVAFEEIQEELASKEIQELNLDALTKETIQVLMKAMKKEIDEISEAMNGKDWTSESIKVRMNVFSQMTQNYTQFINQIRLSAGKPTSISKHEHSYESMSLKELEDKEEEMNALLGRKVTTKRITIEEKVSEAN